MATIAIDARFYGAGHTGLGRYTTNVLKYLPRHLQGQTLKVLLRASEYQTFKSAQNVEKIRCETPIYSLNEQLTLPAILSKMGADLLYTCHFNAPIFSSIPQVVTIHDLIKTHFTGTDTTTRSPWLYAFKRNGYNQVVRRTIARAQEIIVPTNTVKNDILATYNSDPTHIHVIGEAPDEIFRQKEKRNTAGVQIPEKYILFVGNAYPHKNLDVLLRAFMSIEDPTLRLVLVSKRTPFLAKSLSGQRTDRIRVLSDIGDHDLRALYEGARALITPSLMEGYGLPGQEALMVGTPVIASNIAVFREVLGDRVTYFDPQSPAELAAKIRDQLAKQNIPKPLVWTRTWDDVAMDIAEVINESCARL